MIGERLRHGSPSAVTNQKSLFFVSGRALVRFYLLERADCGEIGKRLLAKAAFPNMMSVAYSEVVGKS